MHLFNIKIKNLHYFPDIQSTDISLEFRIEDSTTKKYFCDSKKKNIIEKKISSEVISGKVILTIEKLNYIYEFSLDLPKEIKIKLNENIEFQFWNDMKITNEQIIK